MADKQRDPTGKIGKQVGWLNRNKGFSDPIMYSKVIGPLSHLDITSAMSILKDVEQQADQLEHPTAYILEAAAALPAARRTSMRVAIGSGVETEVTVHLDPTGKIGRQIAWQNKNVPLMDPINFQEVVESLSVIDVTTAMTLLKELEQKAAQVRNPSEWIRTAAAKAAAETGASGAGLVGAMDPTGKISRQVAWLNKNVSLAVPLSYAEIIHPLSQLDIVSAMAVLKKFEEQAANVSDPTAWIYDAAEKAAASGGAAPAGGLGGGKIDPTGKIARQVAWLNNNIDLASPINFADVAEPLSGLDLAVAMQVLKDCEQQAVNLRDPTGFIITACDRQPVTARAGANTDPSGKIRKTVNWLNANVQLVEPLNMEEIVARLSEVDLQQALQILKDVEKGYAKINKPTNFVLSAANRLPKAGMMDGAFPSFGGWGPGGMMGGMMGMMGKGMMGKGMKGSMSRGPAIVGTASGSSAAKRQWKEAPAAPGEDEGSKAISKEVGRLNREIPFPEKLSYSDVKEHLEGLETDVALQILGDLRKAGRHVNNPTAYVIASAKRAASGESVPKRQRVGGGGNRIKEEQAIGSFGGGGGFGSFGTWG